MYESVYLLTSRKSNSLRKLPLVVKRSGQYSQGNLDWLTILALDALRVARVVTVCLYGTKPAGVTVKDLLRLRPRQPSSVPPS